MTVVRRILCAVFAVMVFLNIIGTSCSAAEEKLFNLSISTVDATQGESVVLTLDVENNPGIMAVTFSLHYDPEVLEYEKYMAGILQRDTFTKHDGYISFIWCGMSDCMGDGTLYSFQFKVKDTAKEGFTGITLKNIRPEQYGDSLKGCFSNWNGDKLTPIFSAGGVNIIKQGDKPIASGDINENINWALKDEGTLVISGDGNTSDYKLPTMTPWYDYSEIITSIEISDKILRIGNNSFCSLSNLKNIYIKNPDTEFGYYVFSDETDAVIYSYADSAVETYAIENGITFFAITTLAAPTAPLISEISGNTVVLKPTDGYEYSADAKTWQSDNVFYNVTYDSIQNFYQRVASNGIYAASEASEAVKCLIASTPKVLVGKASIAVKPITGYEYCLDDMMWQESNIFTKYIVPNENYTVYQRPIDIEGIYTSYDISGVSVCVSGNDVVANPDSSHIVWLRRLLLNHENNNIAADFNGDFEIDIRDLVNLKKAMI